MILERLKAVVAAVAAAALGALAGIDWYEVIAAAVASGVAVERVPNRKRK